MGQPDRPSKASGFKINPAFAEMPRDRRSRGLLAGMDGKARYALDYDVDGVVIKVDETADRRDLGFTAKFPARGDFLQIPGPPGDDPAPGHHRPGRADGRPDSGRRTGARQNFGDDRLPGDASQRRRNPAQGYPGRGFRPGRAERGCDSPNRRPDERAPDRGGKSIRPARMLPGLRIPHPPGRG